MVMVVVLPLMPCTSLLMPTLLLLLLLVVVMVFLYNNNDSTIFIIFLRRMQKEVRVKDRYYYFQRSIFQFLLFSCFFYPSILLKLN